MKRGRKICNALRDVRRQIALANDIPYETTDCHFEGDCQGTCPKCESELRYIENQLSLRRAAGKAVSLVGLSLGISAAFASCANQPAATNQETAENESETNIIKELPVVGYAETDTIEEEFEDTINEKGCDTTVEPNNVRIVKNNIEIDDFEMMALGEVDGDDQTIVEVVDLSEEEVPDPGDEVYTVVTQQPEFPGGEEALMDFIKKNQEYPASALEKGIQGRVRLSFVVEKDGSLTNIEVLRSPTEELSQEAIRIVKMMPKWHPGTLRDKPVRVKYVLPVTFRLDENNKPIK